MRLLKLIILKNLPNVPVQRWVNPSFVAWCSYLTRKKLELGRQTPLQLCRLVTLAPPISLFGQLECGFYPETRTCEKQVPYGFQGGEGKGRDLSTRSGPGIHTKHHRAVCRGWAEQGSVTSCCRNPTVWGRRHSWLHPLRGCLWDTLRVSLLFYDLFSWFFFNNLPFTYV